MEQEKPNYICKHCGNPQGSDKEVFEEHQETCLKKYDKLCAIPEGY